MNRAVVERYRRDGFVHLRGFLDERAVSTLSRAVEAARLEDSGDNPLSLDSMQFVSNAFHRSEELRRFLSSPRILDLACALRGPDLWVRWDQAVWKGPGAPTFPWHQDNGYSELPAEHLQLWIALTPMSAENGGLCVVPGGHTAALPHRWVGGHVETEPRGEVQEVVAEAGDLVAFSSWLPHCTAPNRTTSTRLAYVAEYLPVDEPDPSVPPPHFVAAAGGRRAAECRDLTATWS